MMTINFRAFKMSAKSFIFWFKLFLCTKFIVSGFILVEYYHIFNFKYSTQPLLITFHIFMYSAVFILVILICAVDSVDMPRKLKIVVTVFDAMTFTSFAITYILDPISEDNTVIDVTTFYSFSIYSIYKDAVNVLSIFLWEQSVFLIMYPYRCVNIRQSVFIKWID